MLNFQPTLSRAMVVGKRLSNADFQHLSKSMAFRIPTIFNLTTDKVYANMLKEDIKIPRMHSIFIKRYLRLRQLQEEAARPSPYRLYERWPLQRIRYRIMWFLTIILFVDGWLKVLPIVYEAM